MRSKYDRLGMECEDTLGRWYCSNGKTVGNNTLLFLWLTMWRICGVFERVVYPRAVQFLMFLFRVGDCNLSWS